MSEHSLRENKYNISLNIWCKYSTCELLIILNACIPCYRQAYFFFSADQLVLSCKTRPDAALIIGLSSSSRYCVTTGCIFHYHHGHVRCNQRWEHWEPPFPVTTKLRETLSFGWCQSIISAVEWLTVDFEMKLLRTPHRHRQVSVAVALVWRINLCHSVLSFVLRTVIAESKSVADGSPLPISQFHYARNDAYATMTEYCSFFHFFLDIFCRAPIRKKESTWYIK